MACLHKNRQTVVIRLAQGFEQMAAIVHSNHTQTDDVRVNANLVYNAAHGILPGISCKE